MRTSSISIGGAFEGSLPLRCALVVMAMWAAGLADAEIRFWVDAAGVTHFTDDPEAAPATAPTDVEDLEILRGAWSDGIIGPTPQHDAGDSSAMDDRLCRLLRGAMADLERGEIARADATLRGVLRLAPRQLEAHWYRAILARGRGRFETAEHHLRIFLDVAGPEFSLWRRQAELRLAGLEDERLLADPDFLDGPLEFETIHGEHFRVEVEIEKVCLDCAGVYGMHIALCVFTYFLRVCLHFLYFFGLVLQCPNVIQNVSKSPPKTPENEHLFACFPSFSLPGKPHKKDTKFECPNLRKLPQKGGQKAPPTRPFFQ